MLLPAFFSYAFAATGRLLARTGVFYLGLIVTLVPLGAFAGSLGGLITEHRGALIAVAGTVVIVLGLIQISGLTLPAFSRGGRAGEGTSWVSVFFLGTVYGVAGVCAGPILGTVLAVAALGGNPVYGGVLLAFYAAGMVVPLGVLALLWARGGGRVQRWLRPRTVTIGRWSNSWLQLIAGALSVALGVFLIVTEGTGSLGGILDPGTQIGLEAWALGAASGLSNVVFLLVAVAVIAVVAVLYLRRSRRAEARAAAAREASVPARDGGTPSGAPRPARGASAPPVPGEPDAG